MRRGIRGRAVVAGVVCVVTAALLGGCGARRAAVPAAGAASAPAPPPASAPPSPTASAPAGPAAARPAGLPRGYDASRDPAADLRTALAMAKRGRREVLIDFGADWCPDCRALEGMFDAPDVRRALVRDYVVLPVDIGQFDHNLAFAARYVNLRTSGVPALVVLAADGSVRTATDDGSFSNARTMRPAQVAAFLTRWAPKG